MQLTPPLTKSSMKFANCSLIKMTKKQILNIRRGLIFHTKVDMLKAFEKGPARIEISSWILWEKNVIYLKLTFTHAIGIKNH
jgi:hypothetical protein